MFRILKGATSKLRVGARITRFLVVPAIAVGCYNALMTGFAHRYDDSQPRDPLTDALYGAEEFDLGDTTTDTAVLLVHGFLGASNNFNELPARLAAEGYRVRALRLPGHGTTPFELKEIGYADELNYILKHVRELKTRHKRVVIIGHSMGGALCTLAATSPEVDGVVLAGPHFRVTHQWYYILPVEVWNTLTGWAIRWVYKSDAFIQVDRAEAKSEIVSYRYIPSNAVAQIDHFAALARDPEILAEIHCPVLILHGVNDKAASPTAAGEAFASIGTDDKEFVLLERSNHHIFWDNDREQVYAEILRFLKEHGE